MKYHGLLHKMNVSLETPVKYELNLSGETVCLNDLVGKPLKLEYLQNIECIHCGRRISKSFNQGYCYPCFSRLAQCDTCIVSPEKCHYHLGTCREPEWGLANCMKPHIVYLSNTSGIKVGITRESQLPTRWIDQGAVQAQAVLRVSKRYHSGLVETAFKKHLNDRTNWRNMLKHQVEDVDLGEVFERVWPAVRQTLGEELLNDIDVIVDRNEVTRLEYPSKQFPPKITSFNLDRNPVVEGRLDAIKGQYLLFDSGVINIRKYAGYLVNLVTV